MELSGLLGTSFECDCGRIHSVPIQRFAYEDGVPRRLPAMVQCLHVAGTIRRVAVVADARTWAVCGENASVALAEAGLVTDQIIVPDERRSGPVCDERTLAALVTKLRQAKRDLVVAVGSGVISDLCKWASFELDLPYIVMATAASMNGYAAANVAPQVAGVKVLVRARPPLMVAAEPAVIEQAPHEMTAAGFGDTIAKYQSAADWAMNHLLLDEYYCDFCRGMTTDLDHRYLDPPEDIKDRRSDAVKGLFEALFWSGVAMTLVGTSAPASGGEHLLSHTLDMMAAVRNHEHDLHGRQVGLGTLLSAALYQRILAIESPEPVRLPPVIDAGFWATPTVCAAVTEQYQTKQQVLETVRQRIARAKTWDELRRVLAGKVKTPQTIRDWLRRAGAASGMADIGCPRERMRSAVLHLHEIRSRFTVVDLAWLVGVLPDAADELVDEWLANVR